MLYESSILLLIITSQVAGAIDRGKTGRLSVEKGQVQRIYFTTSLLHTDIIHSDSIALLFDILLDPFYRMFFWVDQGLRIPYL